MAMDSAASLLFKIGANTDDASANIARFRGLFSQSLSGMKTQFHSFAAQIIGDGEKIKMGWAGIAAAVAGAGVAIGTGLFETTKKTAELGEQLENLHQQTGLSVEMLSALRIRSQEAGVGFDQVGITVETLARNLSPYVRQTSMAARAAHDLGISSRNADGSLKSMDQMLLSTMDALHKTGVGSKATAAAVSFLSTSGAKMIPVFMGGSAAMKDAMTRAKAMGQMFTDVSAEQSAQFLSSFRDIKYTIEGVGISIGQKLLPIATRAMTSIANFLVRNAGMISDSIQYLGVVFRIVFTAVGVVLKAQLAYWTLLLATFRSTVAYIKGAWAILHGRTAEAKKDAAAASAAWADAWTHIKESFRGGSSTSIDYFKALGKALEMPSAAVGAAATDKLADSLAQARQQLEQLQDQMSKPEAAIENQFLRAKEAAEHQLASYAKLAAKGKITKQELGQYEREYSELVTTLAQERAAKLKQLDRQRLDSVKQLDASLANELDSYGTETYAKQKAAIEKQIAAEREKYKKLGALDQQHEQMIAELRADMLKKLDDQEQKAAAQREQRFENDFARLKALSDQYYQASLTGKAKIEYQYDQEIAKIKQLEAELLKAARTEQQRQQIVQAAAAAEEAARAKETTAIANLAAKQNSLTQQWRASYNSLIQLTDNFSKHYRTAAHQILAAIDQQIIAQQKQAKSSGEAAALNAKSVIGAIKQIAIVKAIFETAESIAAFARLDFRGGTQHALAAVQYGVAASAQISALFGGGGGSSGGSRGGSHAASRAGGASHAKTPKAAHSASQQQAQPVVNIHIDGVISADNLSSVLNQVSSLVSSGSATLAATHAVINGATVPIAQGAY